VLLRATVARCYIGYLGVTGMIRVTYYPRHRFVGGIVSTFSDEHEAKVLQSGVMKIVLPDSTYVPLFGADDNGEEKEISVQPVQLVAVFSGDYILEYYENE
jgi:hypothetical protein